MYLQIFNTIEAKMWKEFATQNYEYFVPRRTHGRTYRYIDTKTDRLIPVYPAKRVVVVVIVF